MSEDQKRILTQTGNQNKILNALTVTPLIPTISGVDLYTNPYGRSSCPVTAQQALMGISCINPNQFYSASGWVLGHSVIARPALMGISGVE